MPLPQPTRPECAAGLRPCIHCHHSGIECRQRCCKQVLNQLERLAAHRLYDAVAGQVHAPQQLGKLLCLIGWHCSAC